MIQLTLDGTLAGAIDDVVVERQAQDAKWGEQNHRDGTRDDARLLGDVDLPTFGTLAYRAKDRCDATAKTQALAWADVLLEEVFEALAEHDEDHLRAELVQVAAVATAWIEAIDRREPTPRFLARRVGHSLDWEVVDTEADVRLRLFPWVTYGTKGRDTEAFARGYADGVTEGHRVGTGHDAEALS